MEVVFMTHWMVKNGQGLNFGLIKLLFHLAKRQWQLFVLNL